MHGSQVAIDSLHFTSAPTAVSRGILARVS